MGKLNKTEHLTINSMGKSFAVTGIFSTDDDTNAYMANHKDEGVIAEIQGVIFVASFYPAKPETAARAHDLANQVMVMEAEKAQLLEALEEIAGQKLSTEMTAAEGQEGSWVDGFDMCVETARAAIAKAKGG